MEDNEIKSIKCCNDCMNCQALLNGDVPDFCPNSVLVKRTKIISDRQLEILSIVKSLKNSINTLSTKKDIFPNNVIIDEDNEIVTSDIDVIGN